VTPSGVGEAIARARDFALAHGDALQRARARAALDPRARADVARALEAVDSPDAAVAALAALDALGVQDGAAVERAVALLAAAQESDGAWSPREAGDGAARIVATAQIAGLLAKTHCVRPVVLDRAAAWLDTHYARERIEGGGPDALVAWAQLFANVAHERADEGLQWCGRTLERGWRSGAIGAVEAARVFLRCDASALPGAQLTAGDVVRALVAAQADDGGFAPASALPDRVEATLDALVALRRLAPRTSG
jgi:hypothetical protein